MSFCPKCGARNIEGATFCAQCGNPMLGESDADFAAQASETADPFQVGANSQTTGNRRYSGEAPEVPNPFRAFTICMKKYANGKGRAGRAEYFGFGFTVTLLLMLFGGVVGGIFGAMGKTPEESSVTIGIMVRVFQLAFVVPGWCVAIRRCHDMGKSGWLSILLIVPLVNLIFVLVLLFTPGQAFPNEYGLPPQRR